MVRNTLSPKDRFYRKSETRRFLFFTINLCITAFLVFFMCDIAWRIGFSTPVYIFLTVFAILTWQISLGFTHSIFGLIFSRKKTRYDCITSTIQEDNESAKLASTAILMPIYNEETRRVYEGLRSIYTSIEKTGQIKYFDFFILSDSTDPNKFVAEETLWIKMCKELNAEGKIYYRRRTNNFHKKAGNVADFCKVWSSGYKYMIILDADSIMSGNSVVSLTKIMEKNPEIGLCQTANKIIRSETLFGRMMQFASNFYGPVFQAGLNYWQQGRGNYWGHNAIIRIKPFLEHCSLPRLPGKEPFGGKILSHDFVEAALLQQNGWAVWLAYDIKGSYEENPPDLIENATRDRRWCQGNIQHTWLLMSKKFPWVSRIHIINGIMSYLGSLLWLVFLLLITLLVYQGYKENLTVIVGSSFASFVNITVTEEAFYLFLVTVFVLVFPKIASIIHMAIVGNLKEFGGFLKVVFSAIAELIISTLIAPIQMMFHSKFLIYLLIGKSSGWNPQVRDTVDGIPLSTAFKVHWFHTLVGVVWGILAYHFDYKFFLWLSPIIISLTFSIPVSYFVSKKSAGTLFKKLGLFLVPYETNRDEQLKEFENRLETEDLLYKPISKDKNFGAVDIVTDPYVNAIHLTTLLNRSRFKGLSRSDERVCEDILKNGLQANKDKLRDIFNDPDAVTYLFEKVWEKPMIKLHKTWVDAIYNYSYARVRQAL